MFIQILCGDPESHPHEVELWLRRPSGYLTGPRHKLLNSSLTPVRLLLFFTEISLDAVMR